MESILSHFSKEHTIEISPIFCANLQLPLRFLPKFQAKITGDKVYFHSVLMTTNDHDLNNTRKRKS